MASASPFSVASYFQSHMPLPRRGRTSTEGGEIGGGTASAVSGTITAGFQGGPAGRQVTREVVAVAVLVRMFEFVERTVLRIQKGPVAGQEVLGDHLFQGHGRTSVDLRVSGPTVDHPSPALPRRSGRGGC